MIAVFADHSEKKMAEAFIIGLQQAVAENEKKKKIFTLHILKGHHTNKICLNID